MYIATALATHVQPSITPVVPERDPVMQPQPRPNQRTNATTTNVAMVATATDSLVKGTLDWPPSPSRLPTPNRTPSSCTPRAWPGKPAGDPVGVQNGDRLFLRAAHSFYRSSNASSFLLPISVPILSSFPISTLLDCGASDNFIDTSIAPLHLIYALHEPISLFLFDGSPTPSGVITHAINLTITV